MSAASTKEEMLANADIPFGRGGARAGSGGQRTEDVTGSAAIKARFYTGDRLLTLLETMYVVAINKPVMQTVFDKDGAAHKMKVKPYSGKEQVAALHDLLDRGMGKAAQAIELTGPDGGPIETHNRNQDEYADASTSEIRAALTIVRSRKEAIENAGSAE